MINRTFIRWFTLLGVVTIFALQSIWLYNTYILIEQDVYEECNSILDKALYEEINLASRLVPQGTSIGYGSQNDTIPQNTYFYDGLWKLGVQFSISEIDSIAGVLLKIANIDTGYAIYTINPHTKEIYERSKNLIVPHWGTIKSKIIPIRLDMSQGIQLILKNPYYTIFERMGLLMIATALMMIFVVGCIVYQIKIISRLKKISQIREDFSNAMVHDMKNPLGNIMIGLSFLRNPKVDENPTLKAQYLNKAEGEANYLLTLTNRILTLSKLEDNKLDLEKQEVPLVPMIQRLSEKFIFKSTKLVHFNIELQAEEVYADEGYMEEVLSNLIDNAIKYSKESVEIKISSFNDNHYTIIKVYDNGLGIPEKDQHTIFNKYERSVAAKRSGKGGATGFGLGLNFVSQVIEAHGGRVSVNSKEGEYSEFVIYVPRLINKL